MAEYKLNLSFSLTDLFGWILGRKKCPGCGNKLVREVIQDPSPAASADAAIAPPNGMAVKVRVTVNENRHVRLVYRCDQCGVRYSPEQVRLGVPGEAIAEVAEMEKQEADEAKPIEP